MPFSPYGECVVHRDRQMISLITALLFSSDSGPQQVTELCISTLYALYIVCGHMRYY